MIFEQESWWHEIFEEFKSHGMDVSSKLIFHDNAYAEIIYDGLIFNPELLNYFVEFSKKHDLIMEFRYDNGMRFFKK